MKTTTDSAIDYVLHWEDSTLSGVVTTDKGGKTRFGISQKANPDLTDTNFYMLITAVALKKARQVYTARYASKVQTDKIFSVAVCSKILDMYVNMGTEGIILAQNCVGVKADGGVGNITLAHWNMADPDGLLQHLANVSVSYYRNLNGSLKEHEAWEERGSTLGVVGKRSMPYGKVPVPVEHG
jgi:lysozyme family protein